MRGVTVYLIQLKSKFVRFDPAFNSLSNGFVGTTMEIFSRGDVLNDEHNLECCHAKTAQIFCIL